jgi:hypothetical protein
LRPARDGGHDAVLDDDAPETGDLGLAEWGVGDAGLADPGDDVAEAPAIESMRMTD